MGPGVQRPLQIVLDFLFMTRPGLVIQWGPEYQRVEEALSQVRRAAKSGPTADQDYLNAFVFWWEEDEEGKIVIKRMGDKGPEVLSAEVGSKHVPSAVRA